MEGLPGTHGASPRSLSPHEGPHVSPRHSPHHKRTLLHGQSGRALPSCCRLEQKSPEIIFPLQAIGEESGNIFLGQGQAWLRRWEERQTARLEKHHKAMEEQLKGLREAVLEHSERAGHHHPDIIQNLLRSELERERGFRQTSEASADWHAVGTTGKQEPNLGHTACFDKSVHSSDQHHLAKPGRADTKHSAYSKCEYSRSAWAAALSASLNSELVKACGVKSRKNGQTNNLNGTSSGYSQATALDLWKLDLEHAPEFQPKLQCQSALAKVVHSYTFNAASSAIILLYSVAIGIQTDLEMRRSVAGESQTFQWSLIVDCIFTSIFAVEIGLRVSCELGWFFSGPAKYWNVFDLVVVLCNVIELLSIFDLKTSYLRAARGVRFVRALRILRIVHSFRMLRLMTASIASSMVSLLWAFSLLVLVMYMFAVILLQGAGDFLRSAEQVPSETWEALKDDFGNIGLAIFSLTQAISGGRSWGEYAEPYMEISPWYGVIFTLFVVFVVFGALNILTGIFVASTRDLYQYDQELVIQEELSQQDSVINQIRSLFLEIDSDKSGTISFQEFKKHAKDRRVQAYFSVLQMDVSRAEGLFRLLDKDGNGEISIEEFIVSCLRLKGQARSIDMASMLFEHKRLYRLIKHMFTDLDTDVRQLTHQIHAWQVARDQQLMQD